MNTTVFVSSVGVTVAHVRCRHLLFPYYVLYMNILFSLFCGLELSTRFEAERTKRR